MQGLKITFGWLLGVASVWLILNGLLIVVRTMGVVQGSQFSVQITLTNVVASIGVWMGLFALWMMIPAHAMTDDGDQ